MLRQCFACWQGRVYAPGNIKDESAEAIRKFNDFVAADERVEVVTLPIRDGVSIVQRRYPSATDVSHWPDQAKQHDLSIICCMPQQCT